MLPIIPYFGDLRRSAFFAAAAEIGEVADQRAESSVVETEVE
jgi:hypothetical protein